MEQKLDVILNELFKLNERVTVIEKTMAAMETKHIQYAEKHGHDEKQNSRHGK